MVLRRCWRLRRRRAVGEGVVRLEMRRVVGGAGLGPAGGEVVPDWRRWCPVVVESVS